MKKVWSEWIYVIFDFGVYTPIAAFSSAYLAFIFFRKFFDKTAHYPSVVRYRVRLLDPMSQEKEDLSLRWIDQCEYNDSIRHSCDPDALPF